MNLTFQKFDKILGFIEVDVTNDVLLLFEIQKFSDDIR